MVTYQRGSDKEDDAPEEKELNERNQNGVAEEKCFGADLGDQRKGLRS